MEVPFLGALPIVPDVAESCDRGHPYVLDEGKSTLKDGFEEIVKRLVQDLEQATMTGEDVA